jgi:hypothetical protein
MKQLFDGYFAPVTYGCAFLRVPFPEIVDDYSAWIRKNYPSSSLEPLSLTFREALGRMAPLAAPTSKDLLIGLSNGWTAVFSNSLGGDEGSSVASYWSRQRGCQSLAVVCAPDKKDKIKQGATTKYRSMQIQFFSGQEAVGDSPRRTLIASNDGDRWVFVNQGEPLLFENVERYASKAVRNRVTPADVAGFCEHFGLSLSEDSVYTGPTLLITLRDPDDVRRSLSYSEAQAAMNIAAVNDDG